VTGDTDIDVLIAPESLSAARDVLLRNGWIEVIAESWRRFPGVYDFLWIEDGRLRHLHLHTAIVSGEKLVKSLRPPLSELYLKTRSFPAQPPFVAPELEFILLILRVTVKIGVVDRLGAWRRNSPAALFRRYRAEYDELKARCDREQVALLLEKDEFAVIPATIVLDAFDSLDALDRPARRRLRQALAVWRAPETVSRNLLAATRWLSRRIEGVGKTLPDGGLVVAICGPDGSGKTSLADALQRRLQSQFRVQRLYLGGTLKRPGLLRGVIMRALWPAYLIARKLAQRLFGLDAGDRMARQRRSLDQALLRHEKRSRLRQAQRHRRRGQLVICERYPLFAPYGDDMQPSVRAGDRVDLLVLLKVSAATALERRPADDPDVLLNKIRAFATLEQQPPGGVAAQLLLEQEQTIDVRVDEIMKRLSLLLRERRTASLNGRRHS